MCGASNTIQLQLGGVGMPCRWSIEHPMFSHCSAASGGWRSSRVRRFVSSCRTIPQLQVPPAAGPRNQSRMQMEAVGIRRPLCISASTRTVSATTIKPSSGASTWHSAVEIRLSASADVCPNPNRRRRKPRHAGSARHGNPKPMRELGSDSVEAERRNQVLVGDRRDRRRPDGNPALA